MGRPWVGQAELIAAMLEPCGPAQHSKPVQPFYNICAGPTLLYFRLVRKNLLFHLGRVHINKYQTWPSGPFLPSDKPYVTSVIKKKIIFAGTMHNKNFNIMHEIHKNKRPMESCEIIGHH